MSPSASYHMLAIDTSGDACSVALLIKKAGEPEQIIASHDIAPRRQATCLLPTIQRVLDEAFIQLDQLNVIAYGCGPGSFTGLRLASSVIQAIGYTRNIPIVAISCLAALAQSAYRDRHCQRILVTLDGRKDEVYWAAYALNAEGRMALVGKEELTSPQNINLSEFADWYRVDDMRAPNAKAILELAKPKYANSDWISPSDAIPVYLHPFKR